jgi:hypothetical protein
MKAALSFKGLLSTYLLAQGDTPEELKRLQHRWQDGTFNDLVFFDYQCYIYDV